MPKKRGTATGGSPDSAKGSNVSFTCILEQTSSQWLAFDIPVCMYWTPRMLSVIKQVARIPVFVMIRPRGGDFLYSEHEFSVMKTDLCSLKQSGADGVVIGILNSDGTVDMDRCQTLIDIARPLPVTFHRAIDMTKDIYGALEAVISLGCERVLTSGGQNSVLDGAACIKEMINRAKDRIIVVPGGGITQQNLGLVLRETGACEVHGSMRGSSASQMLYKHGGVSMGGTLSPPEFVNKVTDPEKVRQCVALLKGEQFC